MVWKSLIEEDVGMQKFSRRDALRWISLQIAALTGAHILAACGDGVSPTVEQGGSSQDDPTGIAIGSSSDDATQEIQQAVGTATPESYPHLTVARGGEPEALVRNALAALGGMGRFVHPGDDVIVKPNICVSYHTYKYAATTNPWVVAALVRLCFEAGAARVRVMDYPFGGTCEQAYARSGIAEQVQAVGGIMETISNIKFVKTEIPQGQDLRTCYIYDDILQADTVINVPIAKHHSLARLTLGMKNLMGTIRDRPPMHINMGQRLADLASRVQPALTVVDAVRILKTHGPTGGSLDDVQKLDTVIASPDIVAADSYAASLFGMQPGELDYINAGVEMGLGRSDLENLEIVEVPGAA
jgi:uncharacterized protein (DUF362 family)